MKRIDTYSIPGREAIKPLTAATIAALALAGCSSETQPSNFAECTGTKKVKVAKDQTYSDLVQEHTSITHEDNSAGSEADFQRIIRGLEMNNDPSDDYVEISGDINQQPASNSLSVRHGETTEVPEQCTILEK